MDQFIKRALIVIAILCGFLYTAHVEQYFRSIDENTRATACALLNDNHESIANCISNE